uniref:C-factor n=1 Tax=Panagrolaimus sp. ES5 TaxID=591445 RepID=A0AC34GBM2_9BILA
MKNPVGPVVLVTGANRGLGLAFVQELNKLSSVEYIFACCRTPSKANELNKLAENNLKIHILKLDVENDDDLKEAVKSVEKVLNGKGLNVLINNAAMLTESGAEYKNADRKILQQHMSESGAEYKNADRKILQQHMSVNIVGPICVTSAFLHLLQKESDKEKPSLIVNISSDNGSIKDAIHLGTAWGNIAYGITKAGLNQYTRYMSMNECNNHIVTISVHPGWLRTDMGTSAAPLSVEEGANSVILTLQKITINDNGRFMDRHGKDMNF